MTEFPRFRLDSWISATEQVAARADEASYTFAWHAAEIQAERMRQCLAEVGWIDGRDGRVFVTDRVPGEPCPVLQCPVGQSPKLDHLWRARELAEVMSPLCLAHYLTTDRNKQEHCVAERRLIKDCREGVPF